MSTVERHRLPGAPAKAWEVDVYASGFDKAEVAAALRRAADNLERVSDAEGTTQVAVTGATKFRMTVEHRPGVTGLDYLEAWNAWWDETYGGVGRRPPAQ